MSNIYTYYHSYIFHLLPTYHKDHGLHYHHICATPTGLELIQFIYNYSVTNCLYRKSLSSTKVIPSFRNCLRPSGQFMPEDCELK